MVVPTRDRPDLLDFCLEGLAAQSAADLEVVVSDNATTAPAREVFDRHARPGWRYLRLAEPVAMHDNFERAVAEASGDYVAVVIDKTILHPSAIEVAGAALAAQPADIVTWRNEGYYPVDEVRDLATGRFRPASATTAPRPLRPVLAELAARFANTARRGLDPVHYVRGKIVFGAFSRALLDRIRERTGRVFHPLAPDYTSMVPACVLADRALDVGRPLLVSYNSTALQRPAPGRRTRRTRGASSRPSTRPSSIALPIAGLYAVRAQRRWHTTSSLPRRACPPARRRRSTCRISFGAPARTWTASPGPTPRSAKRSSALLREAERATASALRPRWQRRAESVRARLTTFLARVPPVERLAVRATGGTATATFASPLDAARAADRHYTRRGVSP